MPSSRRDSRRTISSFNRCSTQPVSRGESSRFERDVRAGRGSGGDSGAPGGEPAASGGRASGCAGAAERARSLRAVPAVARVRGGRAARGVSRGRRQSGWRQAWTKFRGCSFWMRATSSGDIRWRRSTVRKASGWDEFRTPGFISWRWRRRWCGWRIAVRPPVQGDRASIATTPCGRESAARTVPKGVVMDAPRRKLQEFMREQRDWACC